MRDSIPTFGTGTSYGLRKKYKHMKITGCIQKKDRLHWKASYISGQMFAGKERILFL